MTRNVYAVIECCRCIGNSVIAECMCIFENEKDAESFYLTLVEKNKDLSGIWFEIQKCEFMESNKNETN